MEGGGYEGDYLIANTIKKISIKPVKFVRMAYTPTASKKRISLSILESFEVESSGRASYIGQVYCIPFCLSRGKLSEVVK